MDEDWLRISSGAEEVFLLRLFCSLIGRVLFCGVLIERLLAKCQEPLCFGLLTFLSVRDIINLWVKQDLTKEYYSMKRLIAFVLVLICTLGLVGCSTHKNTCRALTNEDDLQPSTLSEPFVTDEERDELLNKAIRAYLDDIGEKSAPFTYEIKDTSFGVYEGKEAVVYWVKVIYGDGFTFMRGFIIQ